jgi:hypothetical protein
MFSALSAAGRTLPDILVNNAAHATLGGFLNCQMPSRLVRSTP